MTATTISLLEPVQRASTSDVVMAAGDIVAAVDGSPDSVAALQTAFALSTSRKCGVHVVSVIPPMDSYRFGPEVEESPSEIDALRINMREATILRLVGRLNVDGEWDHSIVVGRVARDVVAVAEQRNAALIVVGKRRQTPLDKLLGGETILDIVRMTSIPVLAVEKPFRAPRCVVVATDFSPSTTRVARMALELAGDGGTMYLAHVDAGADPELEQFSTRERRHFPGTFSRLFKNQVDEIRPGPRVSVETVTLSGKPADEIVRLAERTSADLIACGPHGHNGLERFLLGSVSTSIIRNSPCALLIAPRDSARGKS